MANQYFLSMVQTRTNHPEYVQDVTEMVELVQKSYDEPRIPVEVDRTMCEVATFRHSITASLRRVEPGGRSVIEAEYFLK